MRYSDDDIRAKLQELIDASSLRKVSKDAGITPSFLSQVMRGRVPPGAKLALFVGFEEDGLRWVRTTPSAASRKPPTTG